MEMKPSDGKVMAMRLKPSGDRAVTVILGNCVSENINSQVMELYERIRKIIRHKPGEGILEAVPAFASLLIYYDPLLTDYDRVCEAARAAAAAAAREAAGADAGEPAGETAGEAFPAMPPGESPETIQASSSASSSSPGQHMNFPGKGKIVEIPVCYGGTYGEDLAFVAEHGGLTEREAISLHCRRDYRIYMLGFLPGFPYLGGLDERLCTPRLDSPRIRIPAGSVGIGGSQTGIYPIQSPGGWRLIGRTPLTLFCSSGDFSLPYRAGDFIRFVPIDETEYERIRQEQKAGAAVHR